MTAQELQTAKPATLGKRGFLLPAFFDANGTELALWVEVQFDHRTAVGYAVLAMTFPGDARDVMGLMDSDLVRDAEAFADRRFLADDQADSPDALTVLPSRLGHAAMAGLFLGDLQSLDALGVRA